MSLEGHDSCQMFSGGECGLLGWKDAILNWANRSMPVASTHELLDLPCFLKTYRGTPKIERFTTSISGHPEKKADFGWLSGETETTRRAMSGVQILRLPGSGYEAHGRLRAPGLLRLAFCLVGGDADLQLDD